MKNRQKIKITRRGVALGSLLWVLWSMLFGSILVISENLSYLIAVFSSMLAYAPLALLSIWIYYFCHVYSSDKNKVLFFTVHLVMGLLVSAVWLTLDYGIHYLIWKEAVFVYKPIKQVGVFSFVQGVFIYGVLAGIFYSIIYQKKIREKEVMSAELQAETRQAELRALKSQVNPHFLFNTLNTIFALMDTDVQKAKQTVTELSDMLRYSMAGFYHESVTLREEVDMTKRYLNIEKQRFADRLSVHYDIDEQLMNQTVPPMLLQPLIENAVKHGITPFKKGGMIYLSIRRQNGLLQITVKDTGKGTVNNDAQIKKNGIGLKNLRKRLELLYDDQFSLQVEPRINSGFIATVKLPIQK